MTYDKILEAVRGLTRIERAQLRTELTRIDLTERTGSGAAIAEYLRNNPLDPAFVDDIEKAIDEGCEQISDRAA